MRTYKKPAYQLPKKLRLQIVARDGNRCFYCGIELDPDGTNPRSGYSIDHLDPHLKVGRDHPSNLVAACRVCNSRKKNKTVEEYRRYLYLNQSAYRAASLLVAAMDTHATPFDEQLQQTIEYLNSLVAPIVFFGEREK